MNIQAPNCSSKHNHKMNGFYRNVDPKTANMLTHLTLLITLNWHPPVNAVCIYILADAFLLKRHTVKRTSNVNGN